MNRYFINLRIDNVLASVPKGTPARKGGFLAARDVDAETKEAARSIAKAEVLADPIFLGLVKNPSEDPVVISAEEIVIVEPIAKKRAIGLCVVFQAMTNMNKKPNKWPGVDARWRFLFAFDRTRPRATQAEC